MQNTLNDTEFEPSDYFQMYRNDCAFKKMVIGMCYIRVWRKGIKEIKKGKDHKSIPIICAEN